MFSSTVWLLAFVVGSAVGAYGANLAIGLSKSPEIVGLYFWGFTLSVQAVFFVSGSLRSVLFPAFAKLSQEPARRAAALRSAARLMVAASAPICVLQAVLATPLLRLFFPERWMAAAPVIGLLSLGVVGQPLTALGNALLMAAGEFRRLALLTAIQASLVITPIALAARLGGVAEIAACGAVGVFLSNALLGVSCFKFTGLPIHLLISDSMPTLTAALGAGGIAWLAAHTLNESRPVAGALLSSTVFVVSFLLVGLAVARPVAVEILSRVRGAVSATRAS